MRWVVERDAILRGLTHALSNRIGTVAAVAGIIGPGEPVAAPVAAALQDEAARLDGVLALFRLLPLDLDALPEPLHLPDLVPGVVALHAHHAALRDLPCAVDPDPTAPPVLARHSALTQALLVLLAAGARAGAAAGTGEGARLRWRSGRGADDGAAEPDDVVLTVAAAAPAVPTATWLLGDTATVHAGADGEASITLPTLAAARAAGRY